MTMLKNDPFTILNEKYDAFSHYNTKINEQFMEFSLEELVLRTPSGKEVLLREVVEIKKGRSYTFITRREKRFIRRF